MYARVGRIFVVVAVFFYGVCDARAYTRYSICRFVNINIRGEKRKKTSTTKWQQKIEKAKSYAHLFVVGFCFFFFIARSGMSFVPLFWIDSKNVNCKEDNSMIQLYINNQLNRKLCMSYVDFIVLIYILYIFMGLWERPKQTNTKHDNNFFVRFLFLKFGEKRNQKSQSQRDRYETPNWIPTDCFFFSMLSSGFVLSHSCAKSRCAINAEEKNVCERQIHR